MDMDKVKLTCPVFFYKSGSTGEKCKVEAKVSRHRSLKKEKKNFGKWNNLFTFLFLLLL